MQWQAPTHNIAARIVTEQSNCMGSMFLMGLHLMGLHLMWSTDSERTRNIALLVFISGKLLMADSLGFRKASEMTFSVSQCLRGEN